MAGCISSLAVDCIVSTMSSVHDILDDVRVHALRELGVDFHRRGWSLGTSSNYSFVVKRDPLQLLVTASGKHKELLGCDGFVIVDGAGEPVAADQPFASAEALLHTAIAESTGADAVLHTHSVWGTLLSDLHFAEGGVAIEGYEMLKGLRRNQTHACREWVPIFENTQDIQALAIDVRNMLGAEPPHGFLIRNHGLYTWGKDLLEARRHIEVFEFLFECIGRRHSLNCPG